MVKAATKAAARNLKYILHLEYCGESTINRLTQMCKPALSSFLRAAVEYPHVSKCFPCMLSRKILESIEIPPHALRRVLQQECMAKRAISGTESQPGQPIGLRTLGEYLNLSPATISLVLNN